MAKANETVLVHRELPERLLWRFLVVSYPHLLLVGRNHLQRSVVVLDEMVEIWYNSMIGCDSVGICVQFSSRTIQVRIGNFRYKCTETHKNSSEFSYCHQPIRSSICIFPRSPHYRWASRPTLEHLEVAIGEIYGLKYEYIEQCRSERLWVRE